MGKSQIYTFNITLVLLHISDIYSKISIIVSLCVSLVFTRNPSGRSDVSLKMKPTLHMQHGTKSKER